MNKEPAPWNKGRKYNSRCVQESCIVKRRKKTRRGGWKNENHFIIANRRERENHNERQQEEEKIISENCVNSSRLRNNSKNVCEFCFNFFSTYFAATSAHISLAKILCFPFLRARTVVEPSGGMGNKKEYRKNYSTQHLKIH